jgi:HTH-type transcriptional regulator/antitoxin HigA
MNVLDQDLTSKVNSKTAAQQEYRNLISNIMPRVIRTESANARYLGVLRRLCELPQPTAAQKSAIALLTLLIEDFEERHCTLKPASPLDHLRELMAANDLKQKDLVDIFGTPSIVSEVLHGKRQLTTEHIRRLSERFNVSPELFI